ncbi:MAG TPA: DUF3151 domain-containing protein [Actinomycetota bacterium]|jgi:hypothetical protein|nr:DUF3151 domain-containing protein [Actinomycetota bacterium]
MTQLPVSEPPEVRIDEPQGSLESLAKASPGEETAAIASRHPDCLAAWAALGRDAMAGGRQVEAYAYFRVGYHRGLDRIRRAGWRGMGKVPWEHEGNRGFLSSLWGLAEAAEAIGELGETDRCRRFFSELTGKDEPPS